MNLTLFSDYSLRVMMFAAMRPQDSFSVDQVAEAFQLSRHHIAKVINFLAQRGYLAAKRGRGGGVSLGRAAEAIRLGALLRETEARPPLIECFDPATNRCPLISSCRLKGFLGLALKAFYDSLDQFTVADLVVRPKPLREALALAP